MLTVHLISSDLKLATLRITGTCILLYTLNKLSILKLIIISSLHKGANDLKDNDGDADDDADDALDASVHHRESRPRRRSRCWR